ncbi:DNA recombination mediator Swi5 [Schizosaccharomyces pombe]|uniref:Mating-type switching protein swi5 n=1 Tax=Schizosaccharomyces pombe (strain 972 / ATCC 24843) TaxID=284812 RepID=SWI5_SCHPO|nr:protein Swi5 [Schizosaccharomyces pombe]Q9UUB7.1 RecName: Full=Mating-type switching protein swi5; AltName: Full=DNA repair protein swi5 [Schizosaccharomyces pombe 972h-]3VIQ_B Chain B, Mating-type switching protein swi5 [Schizosaccharomyces pombe 972h-]3VIQ_D Chain D, Mating-type switching protein swi5 [Schizosaccharomyces pombe 972h-]3VIR_A Chain A, Mating-type switching protein swi5 [Schizosaccharomyces pombe 972h-]3VIR_B Chain B, Mating-type switching protein swi5 [Schizosaccharomyces p|eukprot:NP_595453.1 protein Swi5 [Schizosaccharomyces pombe]
MEKSQLESRVHLLEQQKEQLESSLQDALAKLKNRDAKQTVQKHIDLLHTYNEIRDIALGMIGKVAEHEKCTSVELFDRFGVNGSE